MALSDKDKKGLVLWAGAILAGLALFGAKMHQDGKDKPDARGCVGTPVASTVIVIDRTDDVPTQTQAELVARVAAHVEKAQVNELVTVINLTEVSSKDLTPSFSRCKPAVETNPLVGSKRLSGKQYKERFLEPLTATLTEKSKPSNQSPIAQALIDVSLAQYLRSSSNTLLVFSDLLEHVPGKFSMYSFPSCQNQQAVIKAFRDSKSGAQERPKFVNTNVQLNIIPRTNTSKSAIACRDRFWPWFFGDNDGPQGRVTPDYLPGA